MNDSKERQQGVRIAALPGEKRRVPEKSGKTGKTQRHSGDADMSPTGRAIVLAGMSQQQPQSDANMVVRQRRIRQISCGLSHFAQAIDDR